MMRSWGPSANIPAANQKAREAAAQLLAQLAVIRLDSKRVELLTRVLCNGGTHVLTPASGRIYLGHTQ